MSGPTAAVDPPYRLLASTTVVVGVSAGEGDNEVVVTQQSQGVSVYNVQSSECVQHWAIRSDVRLTHAAVLQPRARRVLAVRDHTTAFSWSSDAAEVTVTSSPPAPPPPPSTPGGTSLSADTKGRWACPKCAMVNAAGTALCASCDEPRITGLAL